MSDETFESRRKHALIRRSADLGLRRAPGRPVWGVLMETSAPDGVTTIVATDDGALSLLKDSGDSLQLTKDEWPCGAGSRLIGAAGDFLFECSPAWAYPLAESGMTRFYLLTFDGVMTVEAPLAELASGRHPLSDLYYAGYDVLFLARLLKQDPGWMSRKPAPGHVLARVEAVDETSPTVTSEPAPAGQAMSEPPKDATPHAGTSAAGNPPAGAPATAAPGSEPLVRAAAKNDVDEVARLLARGHDWGPNSKGVTPLMAAAHAGALEPLRLLLAAGVPVDIRESHGYTALMLAGNAGHDVCVRLLLGAGADLHACDEEGFTSLMFAAKNGHDAVVRILMERGADPNKTSRSGMSAVTLAAQKGHTSTTATLLGR